MTDYGQSIPNMVVQLTDQLDMTKSAFTHLFARMLVKVGMIFIPSWSTYDVLDPANKERGAAGQGNEVRNFFFDFPSSETFVIDAIAYRPCMSIYSHIRDNDPYADGENVYRWGIQLGRRRADRRGISDFRTSTYYRGPSGSLNFGNLQFNYNDSGYKTGMAMRFKEGAEYDTVLPKWRPFAASSQPSITYNRNFKNVYVYLGKAGLFCFVGSGLQGAAFGDALSAGIMFAGGRIPGRARVPAQDPNLNRINPTLELPMFNGASTTDYWNGTYLVNPLLGIQHDLTKVPEYTSRVHIFNLENIEQPISPSPVPNVLRSPRLVNGSGAYILSRPVIIPQYQSNNGGIFVGPVDSQITGSEVRPQWEDVFTAQSFRFGDRTVSTPQEYVDPLTSKLWFLVRAENTGMAYALAYDGRTIFTSVPVLTKTLYQTLDINFSVGGLAGPFPAGVTVAVTNSVPFAHWTAVSGQNEVRIVETGPPTGNYGSDIISITIDTSLDPADVSYVAEYEIKTPGSVYADQINSSPVYVATQDPNNTVYTLTNLQFTSVITDPAYSYQAFSFAVPANNSGTVLLKFQRDVNYYGVISGGPSVRNVKIKKYRYS